MTRAVAALLLCAATTWRAAPAHACASAMGHGEEVKIVDEEALIAWDPQSHTETFVRRAHFMSSTRSFGFLVPTPTKPTLGEVQDGVFRRLGTAVAPKLVTDTSGFEVEPGTLFNSCFALRGDKSAPAAVGARDSVRILGAEQVAGFDATILEADDPAALSAWLGAQGFALTPALTAWLAWYVEHDWKITAFVVSTPTEARSYDIATRAVSMTFQTDRPFYPYREPTSATSAPDRSLRVYFLSDQRYAATQGGAPWRARLLHAGTLPQLGEVEAITQQRHGTVFLDEGPRHGTAELYFAPSADQTDVAQPPIVRHEPTRVFIPLDIIAGTALLGFLVARRVRRRRRTHTPKL